MSILVVEDEELVRRAISLILTAEGYEVIEAVHGLMGYSKAVELKPELILMDLNMPVMDGLEALGKLKANPETRDIPVVILTSRIDAASERQCSLAGATDYIKKPWGQQELEERVALALKYNQYQAQTQERKQQRKQELEQEQERERERERMVRTQRFRLKE